MDTTKNLNAAMRYIEKHLLDEIDHNEIAKILGCSEYQFRRMFSYLANMPLNEYIRRRRLSLAADLLHANAEKIIDVALKCGYESPDAFSKAFQAQYGIAPSVFRQSGYKSKTFPPLFFHLSLIGGIKMDCCIIERGELLLAGCLVKNEGGDVWGEWERMDSNGESDRRYTHYHLVNGHQAREVRFYLKDAEYVFTGLEVTHEEPDVAWEYLKVPATAYAIFDIDQKTDTKPQFQGVNNWLEENKGKYKQMEWDAGGRVDSAIFVICQYDHEGKYQQSKIMEMWIPLEKVTA